MIAIDDATNHVVPRLTLLLTESEASEGREITVALYRLGQDHFFAEPFAALIRQEGR